MSSGGPRCSPGAATSPKRASARGPSPSDDWPAAPNGPLMRAMGRKQTATITKIRQICCAGLPSRSFMPMVIAALRAAIPMASCQFAWSDESGKVTNAWSDTYQPRRAAWIIEHQRQYEIDAGTSFQDLVRFGKATGNLRAWWERGFENAASYAGAFAPFGYKWFLDGVVRDAMRPYGCFGLIR